MNDLISWLTLNNTLLIRIGFSAVAVLIVTYLFRFFFMPSLNLVKDGEASEILNSPTGSMNIEELAELQNEIDTLKEKLKVAETENTGPQLKTTHTVKTTLANVDQTSTGADLSLTENVTLSDMQKPTVQYALEEAGLIKKIEQLEARLAEYEIIAEDIADVGQLKNENTQLKLKLNQFTEEATRSDQSNKIIVEEALAQDSSTEINLTVETADNLMTSDITITDSISPAESQIFLTSEIEISEAEKTLINEFENFQNRKKG